MGDVIELFKKQESSSVDERKLTPELIQEYKSTILLVHQMQDQITDIEDWKHAYSMVLNFNYLLLKYIEENEI